MSEGKALEAKKDALMKLKEKMAGMGGDSLGGAMKASVIAKDKEGLQKGLETAAALIGNDDSEESNDYDEMSKEELIALLKK